MRSYRYAVALTTLALVAAGCASGQETADGGSETDTTTTTTTTTTDTPAESEPDDDSAATAGVSRFAWGS